jgi:hypothetical protein
MKFKKDPMHSKTKTLDKNVISVNETGKGYCKNHKYKRREMMHNV